MGDIKACEALRSEGKFGKLFVTIQESGLGGKECSISFRVVEDSSQTVGTLEDKRANEEYEFSLVERTANVEITVKWKDDSDEEFQSTAYNLHTKDIPSN